MLFEEHLKALSKDLNDENARSVITGILQDLFKYFYHEPKMQNLILMELTGSHHMMSSIHNVRELIGQELLEKTDNHFKNSGINFRAVAALLIGGIYYTILHTLNNGYDFADVDLKSDEGMQSIMYSLGKVVDWAFEAAGKQ